jgi:hypothetical protein
MVEVWTASQRIHHMLSGFVERLNELPNSIGLRV